MLAAIAAAVRQRQTSARELVERSFARIEQLDGPINAVVAIRDDDARAEALAVDELVAEGGDPGPLGGLPLLVKDNEDVRGMRTTYGSLLFGDASPVTSDCEVVARLRGAGAIVVGKTNLPEFAFEGFTDNRLFGTTRNPWGLDWSPGGSSGGSGAALVAGMAPLVTGTDGGGSIRIPAAFCGFAGLKPTNGLIGRSPMPSWIDLSTKGPLATSIADLSLLLDILKGPVPGDPTAVPFWEPRPDVRARRIIAAGRFVDYGPLPSGVAASFETSLERLASATGLDVERVEPMFAQWSDDDWFTLVGAEELTWIGRTRAEGASDRLGLVRSALEAVADMTIDQYLDARRRRFEVTRVLDDLLGDDAVLASPTMCVEGFWADGRMLGADEPGTPSSVYNTQTTNLSGHPSLSVPAGLSDNGIPFGLQLTGPRFADDLVLEIGRMWEAANPWPLAAPGYEPFGAD
jgi:Asp-tRNA(Asn)/Glu-tRNA(Gln) amidotransferase A subunit family amidase